MQKRDAVLWMQSRFERSPIFAAEKVNVLAANFDLDFQAANVYLAAKRDCSYNSSIVTALADNRPEVADGARLREEDTVRSILNLSVHTHQVYS